MQKIFQEFIEAQKMTCVLCFSAIHDKTIYQYSCHKDDRLEKQILYLLKRVIKLKQKEFCNDVSQDTLFKTMNMKGAFVCLPLIVEQNIIIGALYLASSQPLCQKIVDQFAALITSTHYHVLRQETKEEIESKTSDASQRLQRYLGMGMNCGGKKIVGIDPIMEEQVFSAIEMFKTENCSPVVIYGESGTGKELVASALHYRSERSQQIYLPFNCAELASADPQMQRIELFGCRKGIATGVNARQGLFMLANKGTLFLDEIGMLSQEAQGQMLRILESGKIQPVGDENFCDIDVRLICANNKPLQQLVAQNTFRADLFYRLCSFVINIPPLRQRGIHDHNLLIDYFLEEENRKNQTKKTISPDARDAIYAHHWPGNVRELRATIRRAYYKIKRNKGKIKVKNIEFVTHEQENGENAIQSFFPKGGTLKEIEQQVFLQAKEWAQRKPKERSQNKVSQMLGIHPNTMTKKLKEYKIKWPK